jgi:hypothetical protein
MSLDRTEATQDLIWAAPNAKLRVDDFDKLGEGRKVLVVEPELTQQFPDPLNRVSRRAVPGGFYHDEPGQVLTMGAGALSEA